MTNRQAGNKTSRAASRTKPRTNRIAFGVPRRKMNVDQATVELLKKEGMVGRWINDEGDRIQSALVGGYEFVMINGVITGDAGNTTEDDKRKKIRVGTHEDGSTKYAYLMAIPEEYYQEDQQAKEERNLQVDRAIRDGQPEGVASHNIPSERGGVYAGNIVYKP